MPSLGADMEAGTLVEWLVKPGDRVKRGDIVAVVETQKGAIEIEIFEAGENIDAEVIDLRSLRPLDDATIMTSVARTRRAVIVDEGWRSGSLSAEIGMRIVEQAFWELDAPIGRVCSAEVPIPYARHLENAAIPQVPGIVAAAKAVLGRA